MLLLSQQKVTLARRRAVSLLAEIILTLVVAAGKTCGKQSHQCSTYRMQRLHTFDLPIFEGEKRMSAGAAHKNFAFRLSVMSSALIRLHFTSRKSRHGLDLTHAFNHWQ